VLNAQKETSSSAWYTYQSHKKTANSILFSHQNKPEVTEPVPKRLIFFFPPVSYIVLAYTQVRQVQQLHQHKEKQQAPKANPKFYFQTDKIDQDMGQTLNLIKTTHVTASQP